MARNEAKFDSLGFLFGVNVVVVVAAAPITLLAAAVALPDAEVDVDDVIVRFKVVDDVGGLAVVEEALEVSELKFCFLISSVIFLKSFQQDSNPDVCDPTWRYWPLCSRCYDLYQESNQLLCSAGPEVKQGSFILKAKSEPT